MGGTGMNRGYDFIDARPSAVAVLQIATRRQRRTAIRDVIAHLGRIRDAERR